MAIASAPVLMYIAILNVVIALGGKQARQLRIRLEMHDDEAGPGGRWRFPQQ